MRELSFEWAWETTFLITVISFSCDVRRCSRFPVQCILKEVTCVVYSEWSPAKLPTSYVNRVKYSIDI